MRICTPEKSNKNFSNLNLFKKGNIGYLLIIAQIKFKRLLLWIQHKICNSPGQLIRPSLWVNLLTKRVEYTLEWNLLEKSVKRPFCCAVSILQVYFTYLCHITFWALEFHFIENLKLILKENQIMKWAGFIIDQWSFHIDSMPSTLQTMIFRYNYKSNDVFIQLIHYKVDLTFQKFEIEMNSLGNILY